MDTFSRILITGSAGLVGSAIHRRLKNEGFRELLTPRRKELNLLDSQQVDHFFSSHKPEYVFLSAAKVGGIHANSTFPADFIVENLKIQMNIIEASFKYKIKKLLFMGSSCIYPKFAKQPISENELLKGELEATNKAYAIAKIAGIITCQSFNQQHKTNYISVMPTNLYGLNDNYHPENSHVIPGLIHRLHEAKTKKLNQVPIWGTGSPLREFLYSDDLADACLFLMKNYDDSEIINIGSGQEVSIKELANLIKETVGYQGSLTFDSSKPDGTPRKLLNSEKINSLGWKATTSMREGLSVAYRDYLTKLS